MKIDSAIRLARSQDIPACAAIVNHWIDETDWLPRVHTPEEVARHYKDVIYRNCKILVVAAKERVIGFVALDPDHTIVSLHVLGNFRSQGVGHLLLENARIEFPNHMQLWTFQNNVRAQAFYQREGFAVVNQTDGDNEEGLADLLMEWRA